MNWLDITLILAVVISIVEGLRRGFARTAIGFVALIVAVGCGLWFYRTMGFYFREIVPSKPGANAAGFAFVFVAVMVVGAVVEWLAAKFFKVTHLTWLDRLMGGGFGVVRGLFFCTMTVLVLMAFAPAPLSHFLVESRLVPYFTNAGHLMASAAPEEVRDGYRKACRDLESALPDNLKKQVQKIAPEPM